jgi:hypothetical protein
MILPPATLWVRVTSPERRRPVRLWLPLFLLWLILLPLLLLTLVIAAVVDVVLLVVGEPYHRYTLLLIRCLQLLAETRGTVVRVNSRHTVVDVTIA